MNHPKFQSEDQQSAIAEFVVRNCKGTATEAKSEVEVVFEESVEQEVLDAEFDTAQ